MLDSEIPVEIISLIPPEFAYQNRIVPLEMTNGILKVGFCNENIRLIKNDIEFLTGKQIVTIKMPEEDIVREIETLYSFRISNNDTSTSVTGEFQVVEKATDDTESDKKEKGIDEFSVVSLVNKIITKAIDSRVSDIHIEAYEKVFRVRYRLDGVLHEMMHPPLDKKNAILSRMKIMADLDIAEKRRPQDGRIRVRREEKVIDIRVSTLPTDFGEKIVLRILDKSQLNLDLEKLGFEEQTIRLFKKTIDLPYGMILVTGPTGSGKTTTLYATLNYLNTSEVNIITIEDPIEYNLTGINQSQVRSDIGFTFAKALRAFLRQDPDIIMVGEIRDGETAEIAIRAALTGHLVFSTLHTNNAADTLTRLIDMGQEPFLISSSVKMVIAQRLLRTICEHCKEEDKNPSGIDQILNIVEEKAHDMTFYRGRGCEKCNETGYSGRTAIFEVMPISDNIAEAINRRANAQELRSIASECGMSTLQQNAAKKLCMGITTVEEVLREIEF